MTRAAEFLRAPRVPAACPVSAVKIRTVRTNAGAHYGAAAWIVRDSNGQLVETIVGDDSTESRFFARWPWFSTQEIGRYPALTAQAWPLAVDVSPTEFERLSTAKPWTELGVQLRARADRCERYSAVCDAVNNLRAHGVGWDRGFDCERTATIYHRTRAFGGDHVSEHLRRAMAAFVREGWAELVGDPAARMPSTAARVGEIFGSYRATDSTPAYR